MSSSWIGRVVRYGTLLVSSCVAGNVTGAGFALNETSAGAAGTAYAGRAANPEDASIMSANPAGIAFLDAHQFTIGGGLVVPREKYSHGEGKDSTGSPVTNLPTKGQFMDAKEVAFGFFSMPLDGPLGVGLGVYIPYAAATEYEDDFVGRYMSVGTELIATNFQPTFSWKFSDQFAFGIGLILSHLDGELVQVKGNGPLVTDNSESIMTGHDWGYGWNAGFIWRPDNDLSIGVAYTSRINYIVEGDVELKGYFLNAKSDAYVELTLPEKWELSGVYQLNDRWTVMAGAIWTRWSCFDEIKVIADDGLTFSPPQVPDVPAGGVASYTPENWKNVWAWSVGTAYRYNREWLFKVGYSYDASPVRNAWRTARIPDVDRKWLTLGASYQPAPDYTVDLAYGHMLDRHTKVNEHEYNWNNATGGVTQGLASYKARYKLGANVLVMSLTHRL